jgi:hypothetical protein
MAPSDTARQTLPADNPLYSLLNPLIILMACIGFFTPFFGYGVLGSCGTMQAFSQADI